MKLRLCITLSCFWISAVAAQEIVLRHQLDGPSLDVLATQVLRFNDGLKGKGRLVLQDARGLEDKGDLPQLALLDSADSVEFFGTRPRFLPLHQVMRDGGQRLDPRRFYPQILDAADDVAGKIQALPLGLALPVVLTNRALLKKAGLDPQTAPATWLELQKAAGALAVSGVSCPLTTSRFAWIHLENVSSQQGEAMVSRAGRTERVHANSLINVKHLALLASWQKSKYFHYDGPRNEGDARFLKGECAMVTGASSLYAAAVRAGIDVGISRLPHYDDIYGPKPADTLPDGLLLWTLAGHKAPEYKLAARFMTYLLQPDVQMEWVKTTSYLPMTPAAVQALRDSGAPANLLAAAEARLSVPRKGSNRLKPGLIRDRMHEFLGEELQLVWNADRAAKDALDAVAQRMSMDAARGIPAAKIGKPALPVKK